MEVRRRPELTKTARRAYWFLEKTLKVKVTSAERRGLKRIEDVHGLLVKKLLAVSGESQLRADAEREVLDAWGQVLDVAIQDLPLRKHIADIVPDPDKWRFWREARAIKALKPHMLTARVNSLNQIGPAIVAALCTTIILHGLEWALESLFDGHRIIWWGMMLPMILVPALYILKSVPGPYSSAWVHLGCSDNFVQRRTLEIASELRKERGVGLVWTTAQVRELIQAAFALCGSAHDVMHPSLASDVVDETWLESPGAPR